MSETPATKDADRTKYYAGTPIEHPTTRAERRERADALLGVSHGMTLPAEEDVRVGTPGCQRCEVLPAKIVGPGTLSLQLPHTFTLGKVLEFLIDSPWTHREVDGLVCVDVGSGSLAPLLSPIVDRLSPVELRGSRARFQAAGSVPLSGDAAEIESLPEFVAKERSGWLLDILREQRLRTVFHPIVRCSAPGTADTPDVFGYECLMRADAVNGGPSPTAMIEMARGGHLLFQLDLAARRSAVTTAAAFHLAGKVFINFLPNAIFDPRSCLESTVRMADEMGLTREEVVFEIVESERLPDVDHLQRIVGYYRERGFGVALDDVGAGFSSLGNLLALRPDYAKLDMALVRNVHADASKALVVSKLVEVAAGLGMRTEAEGVEVPEELAWCAANGIDIVQGYLFGRPAAPPPL